MQFYNWSSDHFGKISRTNFIPYSYILGPTLSTQWARLHSIRKNCSHRNISLQKGGFFEELISSSVSRGNRSLFVVFKWVLGISWRKDAFFCFSRTSLDRRPNSAMQRELPVLKENQIRLHNTTTLYPQAGVEIKLSQLLWRWLLRIMRRNFFLRDAKSQCGS